MLNLKPILAGLKEQFPQVRSVLWAVYIPVLIFLVILGVQPWVDIPLFTRDTVQLPAGEYYVGIVSDLGMFIWAAAFAVCGVSAYVLYQVEGKRDEAHFLAFSALFSGFFLIDDRLMIHDEYLPGGEVMYAGYVLAMAYHIYYHRKTVLKSQYIYLAVGLLFLGLSISIDATKDFFRFLDKQEDFFETLASLWGTSYMKAFNFSFLLEDGAKLLGIVGWLLYCFSFSIQALKSIGQPSAQMETTEQASALM
ncbi:MAG: hypothetical protein JXA10_03645 [Anaerolineae bacterium]|nr:hypothetical protein [Anaerolineae bacterium]